LVQIVSTIRSSRTSETVVVNKHAGSAGIFAVVGAAFRSLRMLAVSRVDFWPPVSALENSVPGDRISSGKRQFWRPDYPGSLEAESSRILNYCGRRPSASNCRLHSAGGSRSRSTPMPRGKRPSTAALTRSGARNAREMVMLTCRSLHFWRAAICSIFITEPERISSSHRRPRAIALTRRARRSMRVGRSSFRGTPSGTRICRDFLDWGFCQGIDSS
jgi:hypothetical protein